LKRTLAILVLVLVIIYPGAAWLMGRLTEERVQAALALLPQQTPYLSVGEQHYRRGWFRSEQDVTFELALGKLLRLPTLAPNGTGVRIKIHNVIQHGPVCGVTCFGIAAVDSTIVPGGDIAPLLARWYGSRPPLSVRTRLGFFGGGTTTVSSPPLRDAVLGADNHLSWEGFSIAVSASRNNDHLVMHASMPHLSVRGSGGKDLELSALMLDSSSRRALGSVYSTDMDVRLDRVAYQAPGATAFSVEKIRYAAQSPVVSGFMDVVAQIGTGPLQAAGMQLKEAHYDFAIRHLQSQALAALNDQLKVYNQHRSLNLRPDATEMLAALREPVEQLLLARPELTFDRVGVTTAHGQILLRGSLRAPGLTAADFTASRDPRTLLQKIEADLDLIVDDDALADLPALAASASPQLQALARQGYVTHQSGHWHTTIRLAGGRATVNGKALAAPPGLSGARPPGP
jgi:uncharacterized protein YdgA (DUF945 family)